jgi:UDP-N-acetylmuramate--alanine ligase
MKDILSSYFFCGIGGSGMMPLAQILHGYGFSVSGSDRSYDQGRTPEKFKSLQEKGMALFPQDGSGVQAGMIVVISSAVETENPDIKAALAQKCQIIKRADLLALLFNKSKRNVAVAGTSGKSTTTAMLGFILKEYGLNPTLMNGAVLKNYVTLDNPFASSLIGEKDLFITEADESDGSIALYNPQIAVLNNLALDHHDIEKSASLFSDFIEKSKRAVLNFDQENLQFLYNAAREKSVTYSMISPDATLHARDFQFAPNGSRSYLRHRVQGRGVPLVLQVAGAHNIQNAMAAILAAELLNVPLDCSARILSGYKGIKRRMDIVGTTISNILVIDDFAHNPDKIAASLRTLKAFPGRLLIFFQMHGYAPLRLMKDELADTFANFMDTDDILFLNDVLYLGGTVSDKSVTTEHLANQIASQSRFVVWCSEREEIKEKIISTAQAGDRIIIMGARDDSLSHYAEDIFQRLNGHSGKATESLECKADGEVDPYPVANP